MALPLSFSCSANHRDLHSFPTRRSSDLTGFSRCARSCRAAPWSCRPWPARPRRSEEHTSELQSQSNLVCRLLREKKKTILRRLDLGSTLVLTNYGLRDVQPEAQAPRCPV